LIAVSYWHFKMIAISRKQHFSPRRTECTDNWYVATTWSLHQISLTFLYMRLRKLIRKVTENRTLKIIQRRILSLFISSSCTWAIHFIHYLIDFAVKHMLWILCHGPARSLFYLQLVKRYKLKTCCNKLYKWKL